MKGRERQRNLETLNLLVYSGISAKAVGLGWFFLRLKLGARIQFTSFTWVVEI